MSWRDHFPRTPRVAIVGRHPATKNMAPWNDPRWQIWICSPAGSTGQAPTFDAAIEIHDYAWETDNFHLAWLREQRKPIITNRLRGESSDEVLLPRQELIERFGAEFFTSSVAWLMAMAIALETTEEISLFGVEMEHESEYVYQRSACCWLLGIAQGRGIKVTLPAECRLLKAPLYPPN